MDFERMLNQAKNGDEKAVLSLVELYKPLLIKNAIINGRFDEDLYQELMITMLKVIASFTI